MHPVTGACLGLPTQLPVTNSSQRPATRINAIRLAAQCRLNRRRMLTKTISIMAVDLTRGLASGFAAADAQAVDVQRLTPDAPQVASATIVLTPPGLRRRAPLTEVALLGSGCHFTTDGNNIAEIIDIIKIQADGHSRRPTAFRVA